jgi:hypothetical protein
MVRRGSGVRVPASALKRKRCKASLSAPRCGIAGGRGVEQPSIISPRFLRAERCLRLLAGSANRRLSRDVLLSAHFLDHVSTSTRCPSCSADVLEIPAGATAVTRIRGAGLYGVAGCVTPALTSSGRDRRRAQILQPASPHRRPGSPGTTNSFSPGPPHIKYRSRRSAASGASRSTLRSDLPR